MLSFGGFKVFFLSPYSLGRGTLVEDFRKIFSFLIHKRRILLIRTPKIKKQPVFFPVKTAVMLMLLLKFERKPY